MRALGEALGVDRVVVRLAEEHHIGGVVTQWVGSGVTGLPPDSQLDPTVPTAGVGARGPRGGAVDRRPRRSTSGYRSRARPASGFECRAYAGVPLLTGQRLVGWLALHTESEPRAWSVPRPDRRAGAGPRPEWGSAPGAGPPAPGRHRPRAPAGRRGEERLRVARLPRAAYAADEHPRLHRAAGRRRGGRAHARPSSAPSTSSCATVSGCCPSRRTCSASRGWTPTSSRPSVTRSTCVGLLGRVGDRALSLLVGRHVDLLLPDAAPAGVALWGDEAELERVLVNLLANAVKFTPDGGRVELSVAASDTTDHLRRHRHRLRHRRGGPRPGLRTVLPHPPGHGVGGARCRAGAGPGRLDRGAHGGTVSVESEPGRGSRFRVVLPMGAD